MSRLPVPGSDDDVWGQILNDFLTVTHNSDGTLKDASVGSTTIQAGAVGSVALANGSVVPSKLSDTYVPVSQKGVANGVASLDATGLVPASQLPPSGATPDATTTSKGVIQLAGDLNGTAASPTVPALANKVDTSSLGVANGVATLDASSLLTQTQSRPKVLAYSMNSTIYTKTGGIRLYNDSGSTWTILGVRASVGTAPTGSSIIIDVLINGTTIFTTQANRPTIPAAANTSGNVANMDVTTIANGSYFTVNIAQVGSTTAGGDLSVQIEVK